MRQPALRLDGISVAFLCFSSHTFSFTLLCTDALVAVLGFLMALWVFIQLVYARVSPPLGQCGSLWVSVWTRGCFCASR